MSTFLRYRPTCSAEGCVRQPTFGNRETRQRVSPGDQSVSANACGRAELHTVCVTETGGLVRMHGTLHNACFFFDVGRFLMLFDNCASKVEEIDAFHTTIKRLDRILADTMRCTSNIGRCISDGWETQGKQRHHYGTLSRKHVRKNSSHAQLSYQKT